MSTPEHHDLHHEFPEFKDTIHQLKMSNHHFTRLFDEYHKVNREVLKLEGQGIPVADETAEELKKQRLKLKDELYTLLVAHKAS
mgnify:FL=1